jgi:hypothetical protein
MRVMRVLVMVCLRDPWDEIVHLDPVSHTASDLLIAVFGQHFFTAFQILLERSTIHGTSGKTYPASRSESGLSHEHAQPPNTLRRNGQPIRPATNFLLTHTWMR